MAAKGLWTLKAEEGFDALVKVLDDSDEILRKEAIGEIENSQRQSCWVIFHGLRVKCFCRASCGQCGLDFGLVGNRENHFEVELACFALYFQGTAA